MTTKKLFLAAVFSISFLAFDGHKAFAINEFCQPDQTTYERIGNAFKALDIRKTVQNMLTSAITDGAMNIVANRNPQQMMECAWYILDQERAASVAAGTPFQHEDLLTAIETDCPEIAQAQPNCSDFVEAYNAQTSNSNKNGLAFNQTTTSGSLLGIANTVEGVVKTEPLPTNLAYFWNDTIAKVPFAGTALAAEVKYANAPLIDTILTIWKTSRNIAFGVLAIVMLVIGIMIMTRKKLSPQLVVTAQYTLPRIALAVILIVFSYPIGAVLASSMRYLADLMGAVVLGSASTNSLSGGGIAGIIAYILSSLLFATGAALPIMIVVTVSILVIVVLYITIWIKAILLFMKLIISIIFAPISFALSAIPGNEGMMSNWFKQALVNVLSYVGMFTFLNVGVLIIREITRAPSAFNGTNVAGFFVVILLPGIFIWILLQTLKVPGKIQTFIMGDPRKPGGRK
ncbi:hypothetical protein KJ605_01625 [Patescibacteria group bacterium]|nr:hypothetical protein [Patescibacteria group bacterium]MBU1970455.1 hypothetical protein [Patescibacteria group bacterium]